MYVCTYPGCVRDSQLTCICLEVVYTCRYIRKQGQPWWVRPKLLAGCSVSGSGPQDLLAEARMILCHSLQLYVALFWARCAVFVLSDSYWISFPWKCSVCPWIHVHFLHPWCSLRGTSLGCLPLVWRPITLIHPEFSSCCFEWCP